MVQKVLYCRFRERILFYFEFYSYEIQSVASLEIEFVKGTTEEPSFGSRDEIVIQ